jgi:hypothetical protein
MMDCSGLVLDEGKELALGFFIVYDGF